MHPNMADSTCSLPSQSDVTSLHEDAPAGDSYLTQGQSYVSHVTASSFLLDAAQMLAPNDYLRTAPYHQHHHSLDNEGDAASHAHHEEHDNADAATAAGLSSLSLRQTVPDVESLSERSSLLSRHPLAYNHHPLSLHHVAPRGGGGGGAPADASLFSLARTHASLVNDAAGAGETGITLREAMLSVSPTPSSNLGLILIALSQICYSCMNLFVSLLDAREGADAPNRGYGDGLTPPLGALQVVFVETLIIWLACLAVMRIARTEHM